MVTKKPSHLKSIRTPQFDPALGPDWGLGSGRQRSAAFQAQELVYDAWECSRKTDRVRLAKKAVALDPDCADAWVILATEASKSSAEKLDGLSKAVEAGKRALGSMLQEDSGHFWGILETRPYMRARARLAQAFWESGRRPEAIAHLEELLRLNPNDNQGNRYPLLSWYFQTNQPEKARILMSNYPEEIAADWFYARYLLAYLGREGHETLRTLVGEALAANSWIPTYLRGEIALPKRLPETMALGSREEAMIFAVVWGPVWKVHEGALERLAELEKVLLSSAQLPANLEEALSSCAWCRESIREDQEVYGLAAEARMGFDLTPWRGGVLPVPGPDGEDIPCLVVTEGSGAFEDGQDLHFMVCSLDCADELREFLEDEIGFVKRVFPEG